MLQRNKENIQWRSRNNMPYPDLRDCYPVWVDPHNRCLDLESKIENLKTELDSIRKLPPAVADVERSFVESFKHHTELLRNSELQTFIRMNYGHPDPIGQLRFLPPDNILRTPQISQDEWEKAFTDLKPSWSTEAITAAAHKKRKDVIYKKIESIEKELSQYPDYPKWREFVGHWSELQASCDSAITPQGFPLQSSPIPDEIEAFKKLGLGQFVDPSNRYHPART